MLIFRGVSHTIHGTGNYIYSIYSWLTFMVFMQVNIPYLNLSPPLRGICLDFFPTTKQSNPSYRNPMSPTDPIHSSRIRIYIWDESMVYSPIIFFIGNQPNMQVNVQIVPWIRHGISGIQFSPGFLDSSGARIRQFQETSGVGDARLKCLV